MTVYQRYLVGNTKVEGWFLAAYRVIDGQVVYPEWSDCLSEHHVAQSFSAEQRDTLRLPYGGCWIRVADRVLLGTVSSLPEFDVASEPDEVAP